MYGLGKMRDGKLYFSDQKGFRQKVSFGSNIDHGAFLGVSPDVPDTEADYGSFEKWNSK